MEYLLLFLLAWSVTGGVCGLDVIIEKDINLIEIYKVVPKRRIILFGLAAGPLSWVVLIILSYYYLLDRLIGEE